MKKRLFQNKIFVQQSPIHGYGVFAEKNIAPHETIEECHLIFFDKPTTAVANYFFEWKDQCALLLGYGAIYNHSEQPNATCKADYKNQCAIIKAKKFIQTGEEIFISYGKNWFQSRNNTKKIHSPFLLLDKFNIKALFKF